MAFTAEYRQAVEAKLSAVVPIRTKAMFGGVGVYSGDLFFALIADDKVYFKVDDSNRADFEAGGTGPFFPFGSPKPMGYYELPGPVLDRPDELKVWVDKALAVAQTAKRKKR
jgi:DNA transformation protein and related proteins